MASTKEVRVKNDKTGGEKGRKAQRLGLLPIQPLFRIAEIYDFGTSKYAPNNWRLGYDWDLSYDANERHMKQFWDHSESDYDEESGLHHLAHAGFHNLALLEFVAFPELYEEFDTRFKPNKKEK